MMQTSAPADLDPTDALRALVVAIAGGDLGVTDSVVAKVDELAVRCGIGTGRLGDMIDRVRGDYFDCADDECAECAPIREL